MIRIQALVSPFLKCLEVEHLLQVFKIPLLNLLDLMRCAESVEEVDERKTSLDGCKVRNRCQVHNLLHRRLAQHAGASLTAGIHIGVVSENGKCMGSYCTRGYIEHARKPFTRDLVKVRDHQKQTLGSSVGRREGACCKRAVDGAGSTCLGLHLSNLDGLAKDVLHALCCPLICMLRHNRRRGNRVHCCDIGKCIGCICGSLITIHGLHLSCHFSSSFLKFVL